MTDAGTRLEVDRLRIADSDGDEILSDISFSVRPGEILGLVGESGSGKTTAGLALLRYLRRGLHHVGGQVLINGTDIFSLGAADLRKWRGATVAYVPQDPGSALTPSLRVGEQMTEVLRAHRTTTSRRDLNLRIDELLTQVNLGPAERIRRSYPHQLSGGQQQRVAIAMAFACDPAVIVLDEPTTGLDVTTQRHILDMVRRLCSTHSAAIYVSHDLAVVREIADRVVVLYSGRIVEIGTVRELFDHPQHPYTSGLMAAAPTARLGAPLIGMPGSPPRPHNRPASCTFAPRCPIAVEACLDSEPALSPASRRPTHGSAMNGHLVRCIRASEARPRAVPLVEVLSSVPDAIPEPVLRVENLVANYGDHEVLHGVSLDVAPQHCLAIVGESGSGKSTLARCLIGLHSDIRAGSITLDGEGMAQRARERTADQTRRIQFVFQNPYASLNPRRTIAESLLIPLRQLRGKLDRRHELDRAVRVLEDVSLDASYLSRYPSELSGGERQRVAIGRALIVDPDVLICDEVTSALDVSVQAAVVETFRDLQRKHDVALVFVTHNILLVGSIAQKVVVLASGEIVESGLTAQVIAAPQHAYTQTLLENVPDLHPAKEPTAHAY